MSKIKYVKLSNTSRDDKRYKMTFYDDDKKKVKTTFFGQANPKKGAFIDHKDDDIKEAWIARHRVRENWNDYTSAGALSRWILWNKKTLGASYQDYLDRFNLRTNI